MRRRRTALIPRDYGHRDASFFLVCAEGPGDEVVYFHELEAIPGLVDPRRIRVLVTSPPGDRSAPKHVFAHADEVVRGIEKRGVDEVWLVIDRDRWPDQVQEVGAEAHQRGWHLAVSNPCFQVWLLLHRGPTPPSGPCKELKSAWGATFARTPGGFLLSAEAVATACKHADAWEAGHPSAGFLPHAPGTHVHHLVRRLLSSAPH